MLNPFGHPCLFEFQYVFNSFRHRYRMELQFLLEPVLALLLYKVQVLLVTPCFNLNAAYDG